MHGGMRERRPVVDSASLIDIRALLYQAADLHEIAVARRESQRRLRTHEVKEIEVSRFLHGAVGLKPSAG